jgi:hypothetical protein
MVEVHEANVGCVPRTATMDGAVAPDILSPATLAHPCASQGAPYMFILPDALSVT